MYFDLLMDKAFHANIRGANKNKLEFPTVIFARDLKNN
jgi:hypothetical protein